MMQAYAEGFAILKKKNEFALDMHQISEIWRTGSVVRSWLLDLLSIALKENPEMAGIAPYVVGFGRRPLDGGRSDRSGRAGSGDHACRCCSG